jgi:(2Fe-2S) ferredoxin/predicted O-methyltransferase YrrM
MEPFRFHVYACDQQKAEGAPCCSARGSARTIDALRRELGKRGLADEVQVTACGSLGLCERGPNLVVYPDGTWYSGVTAEEVPELVQSQFVEGKVLERLVQRDTAALGAEIRGNRDRYLAAMRAKDAAGALPDDLLQTFRGFQESRVLLSALELDLFTPLSGGATAAQAAEARGTDPRATETLLNALVAMGLLTKADGVYSTTPVSGRYFVAGQPDDVRTASLHQSSLWRSWSRLTEVVRTGEVAGHEEMGERGEGWTVPFIAAMHRNATERAKGVAAAIGVEGVRNVLDVGGGSGAYSIAFAQASPGLEATVLDLPTVLPIAEGHVREAGLLGRVRLRAGDLRTDDLGTGHDLVLLSAICHMLDPEENRALLGRCFRALEPGGRIVISEFILEGDKTSPRSAALFSINMLVGTKGGASYSEAEYAEWLEGAGFREVRRIRMPGPAGLMVAVRPR